MEKGEIWALYGLEPLFHITELPTFVIEESWLEKTLFLQRLFWFGVYFFWLFLRGEEVVIYAKCYTAVLPPILLKKLFRTRWIILFEKPDWDEHHFLHRLVCQQVDGVVGINEFIREQVVQVYDVARSRTHTMKFYSDIDSFTESALSQEEARQKLALPQGQFLLLYTGKMYVGQKEIEWILETAVLQPDKLFVLVGGRKEVLAYYEAYCTTHGIPNVILRGFQPLQVLYQYQQTADILLSYYENDFFSAYCRVPTKLANYVCAQKPIILADLPSQRAILSYELAWYAKPESPTDLAQTIEYVANHPAEARARAQALYQFAQTNNLASFAQDTLQFVAQVSSI